MVFSIFYDNVSAIQCIRDKKEAQTDQSVTVVYLISLETSRNSYSCSFQEHSNSASLPHVKTAVIVLAMALHSSVAAQKDSQDSTAKKES